MKTLRHRRRLKSGLNGYTLVELVMVMVLLGIIGVVASSAIMESMKVYSRVVPAMDISYKSNLAMQRITREIHDLKDTDGISKFSSSDFKFKNSSGDKVSFNFKNGNLSCNGDLLANGLGDFEFKYWTKDGKTAKKSKELFLVEIDFTVAKGDAYQRVRLPIFPRRLGL